MLHWSTHALRHTLSQTAISAGSAVRKTAKYALLPETHACVVPIAFETLRSVSAEGAEYLSELGRRFSTVTGDQRETNFLLQRLSIFVQRHNAIAFDQNMGTFIQKSLPKHLLSTFTSLLLVHR